VRDAPAREDWPTEFPAIPETGAPTFVYAGADITCDATSEKRFLGKRVVPMRSILTVGCKLFEDAGLIGAKFGYERDGYLQSLWPVGADRKLMDTLADHAYAITQDVATIDLFVQCHEGFLRKLWNGPLDDVIAKAVKEDLSVADAMRRFIGIGCCGAAFGMVWPDRMRAIYQRTHFPEDWHPQPTLKFDRVPYKEAEARVLKTYRSFVAACWPGVALPAD